MKSSILKLFATNNNTCEECDREIKGTYKLCYQCNQKRQQRLKKYREEEAEEKKLYTPVLWEFPYDSDIENIGLDNLCINSMQIDAMNRKKRRDKQFKDICDMWDNYDKYDFDW
jgi:hypothetical protein